MTDECEYPVNWTCPVCGTIVGKDFEGNCPRCGSVLAGTSVPQEAE